MGWFKNRRAPQAQDPDLERLQAGLAAGQEQPVGSEGATMSADDLAAAAAWIAQRFAAQDYRAVWGRRLAIGYEAGPDGLSAETWFWFNAHPALAALRLDEKAHPFVATCAGYADAAQWDAGPEARAAVSEIHERFFGS